MPEALKLVAAWLAGGALGGFFFGGLLWTVRRGLVSHRPALLFLGSLLLRMSVALAGFYGLARVGWEPLLAGLLGFLLARVAITWRRLPAAPLPARLPPETQS